MDEQEKFMTSIAAELTSLQQRIADSQHTFDALQSSWYITEEEESAVFWGMRRWPNKLAEVGLSTLWCTNMSGQVTRESCNTARCRRRIIESGEDAEGLNARYLENHEWSYRASANCMIVCVS